jgi:hypothetical protein
LTGGLLIHPPSPEDENAAIYYVKYDKRKIPSLVVGIRSYCDHFVSLLLLMLMLDLTLLLIKEYFSMNHPSSSSSRTNSRMFQ